MKTSTFALVFGIVFLVMGLIVTVCVTLYWRFRRNDWL